MDLSRSIRKYLRAFQRDYEDACRDMQHTPELSFRIPFGVLLDELRHVNETDDIVIVHEPRNQRGAGKPDWRIHERNTLGLFGYLESKPFSYASFDWTQYESQFDRYRSLNSKLAITDGIEFVYAFSETGDPIRASIVDKHKMEGRDWASLPINPEFILMIKSLFSSPRPVYCGEKELVEQLAIRARYLRSEIESISQIRLDEATDENERHDIEILKTLSDLIVVNDGLLTRDGVFSDYLAQILAFSLLLAHRETCSDQDSPSEKLDKIFGFLKNEVSMGELSAPFNCVFDAIFGADDRNFLSSWIDESARYLSFVHMTDSQRENPDYQELFEQFLVQYAHGTRYDFGAYYTPPVLAKAMTAFALNQMQDRLPLCEKKDPIVVLDPCCGTGSFIECAAEYLANVDAAMRIVGIEVLPAPYALSCYRMNELVSKGILKAKEREVVLANTLSDYSFGKKMASHKAQHGEYVKVQHAINSNISVIACNPPCSDRSQVGSGTECSELLALMDDFRPTAGLSRRGRTNLQRQIDNPFMQFLRWCCNALASGDDEAVLTLVLPSAFAETESYVYARKYLARAFDHIWILRIDSDGRAGVRGSNVFCTMQGKIVLTAIRCSEHTADEVESFRYCDISRFSKNEKLEWLSRAADDQANCFKEVTIADDHCQFIPVASFDEEEYLKYWPIESTVEGIFKQNCSGIKLAPTGFFVNASLPTLRRRTREIVQDGEDAALRWFNGQDKQPKWSTVAQAASYCDSLPSAKFDEMLNEECKRYIFRPFLFSYALLDMGLLQHIRHFGGGGTRPRPELQRIFNNDRSFGIAISKSPKDQDEILRPFSSFCWSYPDNDLCRRGNSYIYTNYYSTDESGKLTNNVSNKLVDYYAAECSICESKAIDYVVFYTYAVINSQLYLDEFEGALFTVSREDDAARVPIVKSGESFIRIAELGKELAEIESPEHKACNVLDFDADALCAMLPSGFRLSRRASKVSTESGEVLLSNGSVVVAIKCTDDVLQANISGYDVVACWLKFNSEDYTKRDFTVDDLKHFLNMLNSVAERIDVIAEIDDALSPVFSKTESLIEYACVSF